MPCALLGIFAHPDDEILGPGGTLAQYAADGVHVELVCATRGEAGEIADPSLASVETLGSVREAELRCAAETLGVSRVTFLDFRDSGMADSEENDHPQAFINAAAEAVIPKLVKVIRRLQPQVIVTFEPYGGYGHPDHIAINRHTHAAVEAAADPSYEPELGPSWETDRLFYEILPVAHLLEVKRRLEARGLDVSIFDRIEERRQNGWPDDKVHCILDITSVIETKWAALRCHRTQFGRDNIFNRLPEQEMKEIFSFEYFALARPEPAPELKLSNLFDGLHVDRNPHMGGS
jgi:LmbE family N-acetylglucosaminyl deacetylase